MTAFDELQKRYRQRDLAARQWREKGGKVVGYFCDNVPEELILAAGFFPLRLSGDPHGSLESVGEYQDLGIAFSREAFASSMLHMIITGKYDFLDYLVIPHARESIQRMYQTLVENKESDSALKLPKLYYLENLHTTFFTSIVYNRVQWLEFKMQLEKWAGKKITGKALSKAIAVTNESKRLLKKIAALRTAEPPHISGLEALQIIGSSMFMLKEEHNKLLKKYLEGADKFAPKGGLRIFVEGSPQDNLQLYEIIESCGATVVAEDNCWGNRTFDVSIDTTLDPLEAIIDRYNNKPPCSRMFPMSQRVEYCLRSALEAKAQGAIFSVFEFDDPEAWESPEKIKALKAKGIPALYLKNQPYRISEPEKLKAEIKNFIAAF